MYSMFSLNYPCNDSNYFWHIVSIDPKNFNEDNEFVEKKNNLLGVNVSYDENMDTSAFGPNHFIMDIDNKKLFLNRNVEKLAQEEEEEENDLLELQTYIQMCIKGDLESLFLKKFITQLRNDLNNILSKEGYNYKNDVDFFKMSTKIKETNKKIQEVFYNFNLNILMMFHGDNELDISNNKITQTGQKMSNYLRFNGKYKNEKIFCYLFRNSIKYKFYFENFIPHFECMDIFKIPFLFSEVFINLKLNNNNALSNIPFFNIIDTLYFQSIIQSINISVNNIFNEYRENLEKYFKHFYTNEKNSQRQLFILDKKILNKFIYLLNNNYDKDQIMGIFPSLQLRTSDFIVSTNQKDIKDVVRNYLISKNLISRKDLILYSVAYIFAMSFTLHQPQQILIFLAKILQCFNSISIFVRYYINVILQSFYNIFLIH